MGKTPTTWSTESRTESRKTINDIKKERFLVYETETQRSKSVSRSRLKDAYADKKAKEPTFLELPVKRGSKHVAVNSPDDLESGLGSAKIASVSIPMSMFLKNSILGLFGAQESIYVTGRC